MIPGRQYTPELLAQIGWRHRWRIAVPFVLVSIASAVVTHYLPNQYRADTLILVVPQRVPENYVHATVTMRIEDRLKSISQQILSRTKLERLIQDFNLYPNRRKTEIMEDIVERMRKDIEIDVVKGDAFRVGYTDSDPRKAMQVTERISSFFIDESYRDRAALAEGTNQFLESQLEDARRRLVENERRLEEYRRRYDGQLPTQTDANMQGLHNTEMQLQALLDSLNRDRDRRLVLDRQVADNSTPEPNAPVPVRTSTSEEAPAAGSPAEQLRIANANLQVLLGRLKPEHPDIQRLKRSITELQRQVDAAATDQPLSDEAPLSAAEKLRRTRLNGAKTEIDSLDRAIAAKTVEEKRLRGTLADYQRRLEAAPTREAELAELMRDYSTFEQAYKSLLAKKQDSQIASNLEQRQIGEQFRILDPARLPEKPSSPDRPKLYALGVAVALAIGLGFAALAEYFDRSLRSERDVRLVLDAFVLATIPNIQTRTQGPSKWRKALWAGMAAVVTIAIAAGAFRWLR